MQRITKHVDEKTEETQRHFDVVAEDLKSEIQTVAEQVATNTEKITEVQEKLEHHDQEFITIKTDLKPCKTDW